MPHPIADALRDAARLNRDDPRRRGATVHLDEGMDLHVAGDLHGHRPNLNKVIAWAGVGQAEDRLLVLQEIIHGPEDKRTGVDRSIEVLLRASRLKLSHPENVILLMGNHDLAEATGNEITKEGRGACRSFAEGIRYCCGDAAGNVLEAVRELCLSMPLAIRCAGGVLVTHSLPSPQRMQLAGTDILDREYRDEDLRRGGAVYEWTWGRNQTDEQTEALAERLGVEYFLMGHKHVATGFERITRRSAVIVSEHEHGHVARFDSGERLNDENIEQHLRRVAAL